MNFIRSLLARLSHSTVGVVIATLVGYATYAENWIVGLIAAAVGFAHRAADWLDTAQAHISRAKAAIDKTLHSLAGALPGTASIIAGALDVVDPIFAVGLALVGYAHHVADAASRATFPNTKLTPAGSSE